MIEDWRAKWHAHTDGATASDFPFGWVNLLAITLAPTLTPTLAPNLTPTLTPTLALALAPAPTLALT